MSKAVVIGLLGAALSLAGCGDDDGGGEAATTVTETVTTEPADTGIAVPDVTGRRLVDARRTIADAGLLMQTRRKTSSRPANEVLRQDPAAGVRVDRGSTVNLTVAKPRPKPASADCGDLAESGAGTYDVRATGVDCETAIVIARQWEQECASQADGSCEVTLGFACEYRQTGYEVGSIACSSGERRVEFQTGS